MSPTRISVDDDEQQLADLEADLRRLRSRLATTSVKGSHDEFTAAATPATTYTLTYIPLTGTCLMALNGHVQREGTDYTCDYDTGIVTVSATQASGDKITFRYLVTDWLIARSLVPDNGSTHTDNFNRANSTTTPNPASDGGSWDVSDNASGDLWGIDSNQLYRTVSGALTTGGSASTNNGPGGLTNSPIIRTDVGKVPQDFTIDITTPNDVPLFWPLLNYDPTSRAAYVIAMGSSQGTTVTLWRCVGNAGADRTSLGTWSLSNPGTWPGSGGTSTIRVVHDGSGHITLYQNGTSLGTKTDASTPLAATWCGIQCNVSGTGGPHFDNFAVT